MIKAYNIVFGVNELYFYVRMCSSEELIPSSEKSILTQKVQCPRVGYEITSAYNI